MPARTRSRSWSRRSAGSPATSGAADLVAVHCSGHDYSRAGKPAIACDDAQAREALVSALVNDALALLAALDADAIAAAGGPPAQAVALLALVAGQDVEPADGSDGTDGRWRIARRVAQGRVISVVDEDARHARKTRSRRQDGFKAHVCVEPDTGLTTSVSVTRAAGPGSGDAAAGIALLDADPTIGQPATDPNGDDVDQPGAARRADTGAGQPADSTGE